MAAVFACACAILQRHSRDMRRLLSRGDTRMLSVLHDEKKKSGSSDQSPSVHDVATCKHARRTLVTCAGSTSPFRSRDSEWLKVFGGDNERMDPQLLRDPGPEHSGGPQPKRKQESRFEWGIHDGTQHQRTSRSCCQHVSTVAAESCLA